MTIDLSEFRQGFFDEAREHTATMERGLLSLEDDPDNAELLNEIFRAAHSIKGAAGTLGFPEIGEFTHHVEGLLDAMRQNTLGVSSERVSILLQATDDIRKLIAASESGTAVTVDSARIREQLTSRPSDVAANSQSRRTPTLHAKKRHLRLTISPSAGFFATGLDPILIFHDLAKLGQLEGTVCDLTRVPALAELADDRCFVTWTTLLHTDAPDEAIRDVFVFVADDCELTLFEVQSELVEQRQDKRPGNEVPSRQLAVESTTLRVTSEKVDSIIDLVGELVIAQSMVMQLLSATSLAKTPMLRDALGSISRNMQDLQERVMGIRMVPIGTLFGRFSRIVRDTAAELGKTVQLSIEGRETEIDKAVVERLVDPITHLVRNALDHGLETDVQRQALGKTEPASLRLSARHVAGGIIVEVSENGRGLDTQRIRQKAEERGLIAASDPLTDDQIHALIFEPGFSTAASVSNLSGRGVGMDVVRRCVDSLNGSLSISTAKNVGTTFTIRLPLTLAILDGLLLRVGSQTYILPLLTVLESFRPKPVAVKRVTGAGAVAMVRDNVLPLVDLGSLFGDLSQARQPEKALVVVVEADGKKVGLVVDSLIGQSQVVVKSIETHYKRVDGILGATILGDGHVAFILDVAGIVRLSCARHVTEGTTQAA